MNRLADVKHQGRRQGDVGAALLSGRTAFALASGFVMSAGGEAASSSASGTGREPPGATRAVSPTHARPAANSKCPGTAVSC